VSKHKKDMQPYWRPNFVNNSTLPDIKAIRTDFVINFFAVTLLLVVAFFLVQREYRIHSLRNTISGMEQQIRVGDADDKANLKLSTEFREAAEHIVEVDKFYLSPAPAHEFVRQLAGLRPEGLIFDEISFREIMNTAKGKTSTVSYRILIAGEVRSLTTLDAFKTVIDNWEVLAVEGYERSIDELVEGRDADTGIFPYRINITLMPVEEKKGKGDES
jgi:hypothetical protein